MQGFLNISAGVITNDLFKTIYPLSSEKVLIRVAKMATFLMGLVVIFMGMMVPMMGGATNVILSVASITGGAMYFPLIWTLYSKKQNSYTVLATTILSLAICLSLKFIFPAMGGTPLSRAAEMVTGVLVPVAIIAFFELVLAIRHSPTTEFDNYQNYLVFKDDAFKEVSESGDESASENKFGKKIIAFGILSTGFIIGFLGLMASIGKIYVLGVAFLLLIIGLGILRKALK